MILCGARPSCLQVENYYCAFVLQAALRVLPVCLSVTPFSRTDSWLENRRV